MPPLAPDRFEIRALSPAEAVANGERLRTVFRDAVTHAGAKRYSPPQVAAWAGTADEVERWDPWLREGSTWVAVAIGAAEPLIGVAVLLPADHVHLLYVDPAFHRLGIATALLAAAEARAIRAGVAALTANASLLAHPVFASQGYDVVAWEEAEHKGQVFRRAKMHKRVR